MKTLLLVLSIALLTTTNIDASENTTNQYGWRDNSALTASVTDNLNWLYVASVDTADDGMQRMYFSVYGKNLDNNTWVHSCSTEGMTKLSDNRYLTENSWKIGKRNVRMNVFCEYSSKDNHWYEYATPTTYLGREYVTNTFKKAKYQVFVKSTDYAQHFSAKGFTKAWNNFGGNAL